MITYVNTAATYTYIHSICTDDMSVLIQTMAYSIRQITRAKHLFGAHQPNTTTGERSQVYGDTRTD